MIPLRDGLAVFAVEDTSAQLTWRRLPAGRVVIRCGPTVVEFDADDRPGTIDLVGLHPGTGYRATVTTTAGTGTLRLRTLPSPPGEELYRFATMSDLHLGRRHFGVRNTLGEPDDVVPHPQRCADSALDDLLAWGAQRLVVKGDLVDFNSEATWALAERLLARASIPWTVLPGNHELAHGIVGAFDLARSHGVELVAEVETIDVPALRLVLMNSATEQKDVGRWAHLEEGVVEAVAGTSGPVMLLVHHHPQPAPVPTHFPPGIDSVSARRFLTAVTRANPLILGTSGHTHRHRYRSHSGVPWSEVGSTKDFPGTWAGYVVHEGGVRQVVRRVSEPSCLVWLDRTRSAAGGLWQFWSPGRLRDRCFTHAWPSSTR